jgi:hypothetical protein
MFVGQLLGQSGPPIYVSTYTGRQILRVNETDGATTVKVVYTGTDKILPHPEDLTVGPDNKLYICDPEKGQIVRMDIDDKGVGINIQIVYDQAEKDLSKFPVGPQGPRFDAAGTLFFNTKVLGAKNGVWQIKGLTDPTSRPPFPDPVNILDPDAADRGEGLAFTIYGDLLVVNRDSGGVQCLPGPDPLKTCPEKINGLKEPIGIAVNSLNEIFVANRGSLLSSKNNIVRVTPMNERSTYVEFEDVDQPFYLEIIDKTIFVATFDAIHQHGKLWKVDSSGKPTLLIDLATLLVDLTNVPIIQPAVAVGVGRPAVSKSITQVIDPPGGTKAWDFDNTKFEVTAGPCTATITARERPPAEVNAMLKASGINGKALAQSGGEGRITTWLVEPDPVAGCNPVGPPPNDYYGVAILGFVTEPFKINPGIVRCSGSPTVCKQQPDFGYFPEATTLRGPGDPISTTRPKSFSEYLWVDFNLVQNGYFCGPLSPLSSDPNKPAVFDIGGTIPVKFKLTTGLNCTGSFITDAKAVLSAALTELADGTATFIRKDLTPAGKANEPPIFRYDKNLKVYIFNLKNSKATGWKEGLYTGYITSNKSFPQKIFFRLQ